MGEMRTSDLSVGEMSQRSGVAVSALHYYESEGLIQSWRNASNHRRYDRRELRRLAIIRVAQSVGIPLADVKNVLDQISRDKAVSAQDWADAALPWQEMLSEKIALLERLRDQMGFCIGCGCLSLENCPLYNADDKMGSKGAGPRRWIGDQSERA